MKSILTKAEVNCTTCQHNLSLNCHRKNCCDHKECNFHSSAMQIANIHFHYFPLISHQSKFSEKIKVYAVKTVPFELKQCDHSETLRKSIVQNYVDSLNDYYFGFLRKIIKRFDLPEEADDLMHIVHAVGSRYSKIKPLQEGMKEEVTQQSMRRKPDVARTFKKL